MPQIFSEKKRGPERKLPLIEEFFLTMVRLKVDLLVEETGGPGEKHQWCSIICTE
jgi:hypothetical protein